MRIAFITIAVNLGLGAGLMLSLQHVGLALATAIAALVNTLLLGWLLHRRGHGHPDARLKSRAWRILLAALAMALVLYGLDRFILPAWYAGPEPLRLAALGVLVGAGLLTFLVAAVALRATRPQEWKAMLRKPPKPLPPA